MRLAPCLTAAIFALFFAASPVRAAVITFELATEFSGADQPSGNLIVTIDDGGGTGSVTIKFDATNLSGTEFVDAWLLNLDPSLDATQLVFATATATKTGSFADPAISTTNSISGGTLNNAFKADGDGYFDILFDFGSDLADRFGAGEIYTITVTGISTLTASSFQFESVEGGGNGTWGSAAHVQSIGPSGSGSGWVGGDGEIPPPGEIPEPASLVCWSILSAGGAACALMRRRKRK